MTTKTTTVSGMVKAFKAARRCSCPIVAIETPDPAATIDEIVAVVKGAAVAQWDLVRGLRGVNKAAQSALVDVNPDATVSPVEALAALAGKAPEDSVTFMMNAHHHLADPGVAQAVWNLRDEFKGNGRMLVLLGPAFQLPSELAGDVVVLDEPLPTRDDLSAIVTKQYENGEVAQPDDSTRSAALDALVGLPYFTAEQVVAMSLTPTGVDVDALWDRKRKAIENTEGLRVWRAQPGDTTLDELHGIDNVIGFLRRLIAANAFGAIVFIDEGDKAFAGGMSDHTGDSGVSKDQVGTVLSYVEDTKSLGVLLAGMTGAGKTQLAKAVGQASGKPLIMFDMAGMKGGTVGESERAIRAALKVVTATAEGRVLFIMTANKTTQFSPELNRRFPDQFFFDTLSEEGREACWTVYAGKCKLTPLQASRPTGFDEGWTGAEIKRACERAALFNQTIEEAARYIVPAAVSAKATIDNLRREAAGRFLSASDPGLYQPAVADSPAEATRKFRTED